MSHYKNSLLCTHCAEDAGVRSNTRTTTAKYERWTEWATTFGDDYDKEVIANGCMVCGARGLGIHMHAYKNLEEE